MKAEVATLKKTVNKFKKGDNKKGGKSNDKSSDSFTKGSDDSKKKKKKEKKLKRIDRRSLTQSPSLQAPTSLTSSETRNTGGAWLSTSG